MTVTSVVLLVLLAAVLALIAGLMAFAETAFTRVTRTRADALAAAEADDHEDEAERDDRIDELQDLTRRPLTTLASLGIVLAVAQLGVVVVGWSIGSAAGDNVGGLIGAAIAFLIVLAVSVVARGRAMLSPDTAAVRSVPVLRALAPLGVMTVGLMRWVRRSSPTPAPDPDVDEQQVLAMVGQAAAIDPDEEELFKRVAAFDDTTVVEIMTHRNDVATLRSGFAVEDALQLASLHGFTRIPVTGADSDIDGIIGAVHVKDLVSAQLDGRHRHDIDLFLREVPVVPEGQQISNLLDDLRMGRFHLALVVDEHGGVAGVVTVEDILEELVGEIIDEFDLAEASVEVLESGVVHADGRAELTQIGETLGVDLPVGEHRTLAGLFFNELGRVPEVGETVEVDGIEMEVLRMQGVRIANIAVRSNAGAGS